MSLAEEDLPPLAEADLRLDFGTCWKPMRRVYLTIYLRTLIGYCSLVALQIATLTVGWGLAPKSWPAIIGLGVLLPVLTRVWLIGENADMQRLVSSGGGKGPDKEEEI